MSLMTGRGQEDKLALELSRVIQFKYFLNWKLHINFVATLLA